MTRLTRFQRDLLRTAAVCGPSSGQEIKAALQSEYGREITHGQLYPNLDTLVQAGLLGKFPRDRRTNEYPLTTEGFEAVEHLARRWDEAAQAVRGRGRLLAADGG